jgi:hypothetical protein
MANQNPNNIIEKYGKKQDKINKLYALGMFCGLALTTGGAIKGCIDIGNIKFVNKPRIVREYEHAQDLIDKLYEEKNQLEPPWYSNQLPENIQEKLKEVYPPNKKRVKEFDELIQMLRKEKKEIIKDKTYKEFRKNTTSLSHFKRFGINIAPGIGLILLNSLVTTCLEGKIRRKRDDEFDKCLN